MVDNAHQEINAIEDLFPGIVISAYKLFVNSFELIIMHSVDERVFNLVVKYYTYQSGLTALPQKATNLINALSQN